MLGNDDFPVEHLPEGNDEEFFESDLSEDDLDEDEVREAQQIDDLEFESADEYYQALVVNPKSSVVHGGVRQRKAVVWKALDWRV